MRVVAIIGFAVIWAAITGVFTLTNVILGALIGAWALWVVRERMSASRTFLRLWRAISLLGLFIFEIVLSAVRVAMVVVSPRLDRALHPAIVAFPLTLTSDVQITMLANMITLTPGTLSVDVSEDRKTLYVHAIAVASRQSLIGPIARGFERKIIELFE
jgi:multicomponent Na+:H+ antiporter subunit E